MKRFCPTIGFILFFLCFFTACRKENTMSQSSNATSLQNAKAEQDFPPARIDMLTGNYSVTGTRTLYFGNINDDSVNFIFDLSTVSPKVMTATDKYTLLCDYADLGASGWQYVIHYDINIGDWTVQPNDIMASSITPGSFKVLVKKFAKAQIKFYLKTFYINLSGNDRVTEETLIHE